MGKELGTGEPSGLHADSHTSDTHTHTHHGKGVGDLER